jgi:hypothetical protein
MKWSIPAATLCLLTVLLAPAGHAWAAPTPVPTASSVAGNAPRPKDGCPLKCAQHIQDTRGKDPGIGPDEKSNLKGKRLAHRKAAANPAAAPVIPVAPAVSPTPAAPVAPAAPRNQSGQ